MTWEDAMWNYGNDKPDYPVWDEIIEPEETFLSLYK